MQQSGVKAQYESEVVYGALREDLEKLGVLFIDTDSAVREHPDIVRKHTRGDQDRSKAYELIRNFDRRGVFQEY
jgi:Fe-S cluster assembly scaffold protein SufB